MRRLNQFLQYRVNGLTIAELYSAAPSGRLARLMPRTMG